MFFKMEHTSVCSTDIARTLRFYEEALGLKEVRRKSTPAMEIIFLGNDMSSHQIEVIYRNAKATPYEFGDNPMHLAFRTDNIEEARALHKRMGCFFQDVPEFGVYYIKDPDGCLLEIMPVRK